MSNPVFSQPTEQRSESHQLSDKGAEAAMGKAAADAYAPGERPQGVKSSDTSQKALPKATFDGQSIVFGSGDGANSKTDAQDYAHQNHPDGEKIDQHDLSPKNKDAATGVSTEQQQKEASHQLALDIQKFAEHYKDKNADQAVEKDVAKLPEDASARATILKNANAELQKTSSNDGTHFLPMALSSDNKLHGASQKHIARPLGKEGIGDRFREVDYTVSASSVSTSEDVVYKLPHS